MKIDKNVQYKEKITIVHFLFFFSSSCHPPCTSTVENFLFFVSLQQGENLGTWYVSFFLLRLRPSIGLFFDDIFQFFPISSTKLAVSWWFVSEVSWVCFLKARSWQLLAFMQMEIRYFLLLICWSLYYLLGFFHAKCCFCSERMCFLDWGFESWLILWLLTQFFPGKVVKCRFELLTSTSWLWNFWKLIRNLSFWGLYWLFAKIFETICYSWGFVVRLVVVSNRQVNFRISVLSSFWDWGFWVLLPFYWFLFAAKAALGFLVGWRVGLDLGVCLFVSSFWRRCRWVWSWCDCWARERAIATCRNASSSRI